MSCYHLPMFAARGALAAVLVTSLGGCPLTDNPGGECQIDADCGGGGDVCARDGMCAAASTVRAVTASWTINGAVASGASCAAHPDLFVTFLGSDRGDTLGYAPVPCAIGQYVIDKLPVRFRQVELGVDGGTSDLRAISAAGTVALDLRF